VSTLLCVAHGSRDPRHAATIAALMRAVRSQRPGVRAETAYLDHCAPTVAQAVSALEASGERDVVVVPLLLTEAYHSKVDVPGVIRDAAARHPRLRFRTADVLGPDPLLVQALERRLREAGVWPRDRGTGVVLASAGTSDRVAQSILEGIATDWQRQGWSSVLPAFASAAGPTTEHAVRALRAAGCRRVVVASYFLAPGFLPDRARAGAAAAGATAVADVLGAAPEVARVVLRRYDDALSTLAGARSSVA
jgi:sirohydrochlorin ferrochelatase